MFTRARQRASGKSKSTLDLTGSGLSGINGEIWAHQVISYLRSTPTKELILSHNEIGDDGASALFEFLESPEGRSSALRVLHMNDNGLGNQGLKAISSYVRGNRNLKSLFLQNSNVTGDPEVITEFTSALNQSVLSHISLTGSFGLSDTFSECFFPNLTTPYINTLELSIIGLTHTSVPCIVEYLASHRAKHLASLKANGNRLGLNAVRSIVRCVRGSNYSLEALELFANTGSIHDTQENIGTVDEDDPITYSRETMFHTLHKCLERNQDMRRIVVSSALNLLISSRALLLASHTTQSSKETQNASWPNLPTELRLEILSYIAPTLSNAQQFRIFNFASDASTLPEIGILPSPGKPMPTKSALRAAWLMEVGCGYYDHFPPEAEDPTDV